MPPRILAVQAVIKRILKPLLFRDVRKPIRVKGGPARGLVLQLNRRHELQKELGLWEREAHPIYRRYVKPGCTVFDVGAADGDSALMLGKLAFPGTVVALEPDADLRRRLAQNAALNPDLPSIRIVPVAAGASDGDQIVTLDTLVTGGVAPAPAFVKIDVDGAEVDVLEGMARLLETVRPVVFVEVHGTGLEQQCLLFLASRGYAARVIKNAWWRAFYPEHRSGCTTHNRWVLGVPRAAARVPADPHKG